MKILHVGTYDVRGGASLAMYRLHRGLRQRGVDSSVFVRDRSSDDPDVHLLPARPSLSRRLRRRLRWEHLRREQGPYLQALQGDLFSSDRSVYSGELVPNLPSHDLVNLHWVAGFIDYAAFFSALPEPTPIVWTLHDMNPFTGGCHHDDGCGRFQVGCGACPKLGSGDEHDLSQRILRRKRIIFRSIRPGRIQVVCPSQWLAGEASRSSLLSGLPVTTIANGVDTDVFRPLDRHRCRSALGIPGEATVVIFVASSRDNPHKGLEFLLKALEHVAAEGRYCLVTVGHGRRAIEVGIRTIDLGPVEDERLLAEAYSAADVFALPSLRENLPNTVIEALACGIPVVAHRVGGVSEMVRPGVTGELVDVGDVGSLAAAIVDLAARSRDLSVECRRVAVTEYSLDMQSERYERLYQQMLARRGRDAA
jgi:glycosyltransferase involved in cell wall biosynthesis